MHFVTGGESSGALIPGNPEQCRERFATFLTSTIANSYPRHHVEFGNVVSPLHIFGHCASFLRGHSGGLFSAAVDQKAAD